MFHDDDDARWPVESGFGWRRKNRVERGSDPKRRTVEECLAFEMIACQWSLEAIVGRSLVSLTRLEARGPGNALA